MHNKGTISTFARSLAFLAASAAIAACSGGSNSSAGLLPQSVSSNAPIASLSTSTASGFSIVQTSHAGGTYASTVSVHLSKAPVAGHVLVLFFEQNKSAKFPYAGQVSWPANAGGSQWSYDGGTASLAILHHVVQSGETGTYTLNVGGAGSGWEDYMVAEVSGASAGNPVNKVQGDAISSGTTQFNFGSGVRPTVVGAFPLAFFSAHQDGHSWSSITSGWTIASTNGDYSEMIASGPVQAGTTAVNATAVLSSGSNYTGSADILLLNPASGTASPGPTAAPTTAPTSGPAPTPTPGPVSTPAPAPQSSGYSYHGCLVYAANDWYTTNLIMGGSSYVSNAVDPNSANIIANMNNALPNLSFNYGSGASGIAGEEAVNLATNSTPRYTVQGTTMKNDPYNDDSNNQMPWTNGFLQEGTIGCAYDCHSIALNTSTCVDYETYRYGSQSWNGSSFTASNGYVHNLHYPLNNQYSGDSGAVDAAGVPLLGSTDFGEELSQSSINHIIGFIWGGPSSGTYGVGGYVAPATNAESCGHYCTNALPYGARLRLHSSYACPSAASSPQANKVCNQLKTYGMMLTDTAGSLGGSYGQAGLRLGESAGGGNPWNNSDMQQLLSNLRITDFDVMNLGTIH